MNNTGGIQIRLGDLIYGILKRWKMILVLTFIGLVFGVLISAFAYMQGSYSNFQIDASFVVLTKNSEDNFTSYGTAYQHPNDYDFATELVESVNYVIKSDMNMTKAIDKLKIIGIKPQDISQNLTLSAYSSTSIVEATFTWRNAEEGIEILNAVLEASQSSLPETLKVGELSIINKPAARQSLTGQIGGSVWGYMTVLGFLAGVGYVVLELLMRPTLTNLNDVENVLGLESLGTIPQDKKYFRNKHSLLVDDEVTSPAVQQNYASTAFILRNRLSAANAPHCFYVTSTIIGEGKTMVAANLAIQLSDMECKVLLIDMNNHNPTLGKLFLDHVDHDRSLNSLYKGDATIEESIYTLTGYLDLLPMVMDRQPIPMEGTVFDLIKGLEKNYEYVIIDTAPVGQYSDVLSLNAIADTVLFVVGYDAATIPEIISAVEKLDKSGIRLLGTVVNGVQNLTGMTRNDESEDRKSQLKKNKTHEPLIWEKAFKSYDEKKTDKRSAGNEKRGESPDEAGSEKQGENREGAGRQKPGKKHDKVRAEKHRRRRMDRRKEKTGFRKRKKGSGMENDLEKKGIKEKEIEVKETEMMDQASGKADQDVKQGSSEADEKALMKEKPQQNSAEGKESSSEKPRRRNALLELMEEDQEYKSSHVTISDNDAREALFKIGMEGDFGDPSDPDETT